MKIIYTLRGYYRRIIPKRIRDWNTKLYFIALRYFYRKRILSFLAKMGKKNLSVEEMEIFEYLKQNKMTVFPGHFQDKYWEMKVDVLYDKVNDLNYVNLNMKRLFFKRGMPLEKIIKMVRGLSIEQDENSPHRYFSKDFNIENNEVVYDIGAADGSFALSYIEKIDKLYIFEPDPLWIEAIRATYAPWKEKVVLVDKFVTSSSKPGCTSMDDFIQNNVRPDLLKIDVDGEEMNLLRGFKKYLGSYTNSAKIVICTYHKQNDEIDIGKFLSNYGFTSKPSKGYMLFYFDTKFAAPYLRRGVLRAKKLIN